MTSIERKNELFTKRHRQFEENVLEVIEEPVIDEIIEKIGGNVEFGSVFFMARINQMYRRLGGEKSKYVGVPVEAVKRKMYL